MVVSWFATAYSSALRNRFLEFKIILWMIHLFSILRLHGLNARDDWQAGANIEQGKFHQAKMICGSLKIS